jgi:hypothetical protein
MDWTARARRPASEHAFQTDHPDAAMQTLRSSRGN